MILTLLDASWWPLHGRKSPQSLVLLGGIPESPPQKIDSCMLKLFLTDFCRSIIRTNQLHKGKLYFRAGWWCFRDQKKHLGKLQVVHRDRPWMPSRSRLNHGSNKKQGSWFGLLGHRKICLCFGDPHCLNWWAFWRSPELLLPAC